VDAQDGAAAQNTSRHRSRAAIAAASPAATSLSISTTTAPRSAAPKKAATHSGEFGAHNAIRSPWPRCW